jgi:hypothetical protein
MTRNTCRLQFRQIVKELCACVALHLALRRVSLCRRTDQHARWSSLALACCGRRDDIRGSSGVQACGSNLLARCSQTSKHPQLRQKSPIFQPPRNRPPWRSPLRVGTTRLRVFVSLVLAFRVLALQRHGASRPVLIFVFSYLRLCLCPTNTGFVCSVFRRPVFPRPRAFASSHSLPFSRHPHSPREPGVVRFVLSTLQSAQIRPFNLSRQSIGFPAKSDTTTTYIARYPTGNDTRLGVCQNRQTGLLSFVRFVFYSSCQQSPQPAKTPENLTATPRNLRISQIRGGQIALTRPTRHSAHTAPQTSLPAGFVC